MFKMGGLSGVMNQIAKSLKKLNRFREVMRNAACLASGCGNFRCVGSYCITGIDGLVVGIRFNRNIEQEIFYNSLHSVAHSMPKRETVFPF